ncbi:MAG: hypothetical protein IT436_00170 [Phycisphaerales bacterium]|nr:hypothetical protein [Phycisphaerales bacterium]
MQGRPDNGGLKAVRGWIGGLLFVLGVVGVLGVAGVAGPALGQTGEPAGGEAGVQGDGGEIKIEAERFGVGEVLRAGEWVGVRLRLMDGGLKPRDIVVQIPGSDPDGDPPLFRREMASNPGAWYGVWLYFRMPASTTSTPTFEVRAYEYLAGESKPGEAREQFRTGRLLGQAFITPRAAVPSEPEDMIAVVGARSYGLASYTQVVPGGSAPQGHERVRIVNGIQPEDAPDRWMGWAPFRVIVWGAGDPGKLRGDRARALREWVERGGHLVVVLPGYGETWTNPSANELHDLLPAVKLARREGVDLAAYAPLLTKRKNPSLPKDAVVHEMAPMEGAAAGEAIRIFNGPGGACVAARRLVGVGAVDLVGLDLNARGLADQDLLEADVFWNRLLGRRGEYRSAQELADLDKQDSLNKSFQARADYELDIPRLIAKTGKAGAALLLGVVVFIIYWVVAGPGGYAALKWKGLQRHAWVAYAGAAAAFTLIAWGGATALRPGKIEADHLTFMDHVFGQPVERTRTWASVLIPWYGEATLAVGVEDDPLSPGRSRFVNTIAPWAGADAESSRGSFPDARGYDVDAKSPWTMTVPTRSTVKQVVMDWAGAPRWKMPVPVGESAAIRRVAGGKLEGVLKHELPGPLRNLVVIDVSRQPRLGAPPGAPISEARAYKWTREWEPGQELSLAEVTKDSTSQANFAERYLEQLAASARGVAGLVPGAGPSETVDAPQRFIALSLYSQLKPPELTNVRDEIYRVRRSETHAWDLGRWFGQPCVIVLGFVGGDGTKAESPTPLTVNGEAVAMRGVTLVRWVYPMPDDPPAYPVKEPEPAPAGPSPRPEGGSGSGPGPSREK